MEYFYISYDVHRNVFVSLDGDEKNIKFKADNNYEYYLHKSRKILIKIKKQWLNSGEDIGELINANGDFLDSIPSPNLGRLYVDGVVSGDQKKIKFLICPEGNRQPYFLIFDFSERLFSSGGSQVR